MDDAEGRPRLGQGRETTEEDVDEALVAECGREEMCLGGRPEQVEAACVRLVGERRSLALDPALLLPRLQTSAAAHPGNESGGHSAEG